MSRFTPEAAPQAQQTAEDVAPTLDFASMRYMSEEEQAQKMADWQQSVVDYAIRRATEAARSEIAPVRDEYEAKRRIAENDAAKATIYADPRFASFRERDADIRRYACSKWSRCSHTLYARRAYRPWHEQSTAA